MDYTKIMATWWSGNCYHLEQLNAIISSTDVKSYAYILHDKCKKEDSDELKKPHYHYLIQLTRNQRGSWFKQFASEDMGIVFAKPVKCAESAYNYLIHDTATARKQGKHLYDPTERTSTIDTFDNEDKKEDEHLELYIDLIELVHGKITWRDLIQKKPKRIHMIANIKVAYDMIFFETHGYRYYDKHPYQPYRPDPRLPRHPKPPQNINPETGEIKSNHIMTEITDPKELAKMPF